MVEILVDNRDAFSAMFANIDVKLRKETNVLAEEVARDVFMEIMQRQPDGTKNPDPLRSERPSERQGLVPIEKGWLGGPRLEHVVDNATDFVLRSESEHIEYFTNMMGRRQWLGTKNTRGIDADKAKYLRFWWMGREWRAKHVDHRGFTPTTDFVEDAWRATEPGARKKLRDTMRLSLITAADEVK